MPPPERLTGFLAALGLGLVLAVVIAAAGIRLEIGVSGLRILHRIAASLEVVAVGWLGWMAWRARADRPGVFRAALFALGLTAALSLIGIAAGQKPPPAAAAANLLGGLVLAAVFAWIFGKWGQTPFLSTPANVQRKGSDPIFPILGSVIGAMFGIQLVLGARVSLVERYAAALPVHALLAMILVALLGWVALARVGGRAGKVLFVLALAAPIGGFTSLHYEYSIVAALVHAAAAALLLASTAYALGRAA